MTECTHSVGRVLVYLFVNKKTAPENRFGFLKAVKPFISITNEMRDNGGNKPQERDFAPRCIITDISTAEGGDSNEQTQNYANGQTK